jgi:hypothetical protein
VQQSDLSKMQTSDGQQRHTLACLKRSGCIFVFFVRPLFWLKIPTHCAQMNFALKDLSKLFVLSLLSLITTILKVLAK